MSDEFEKLEKEGRDRFKSFCENNSDIWHLAFTEGKYALTDALILSGGSLMAVEIKTRSFNSDDYPNWVLQKDKFEALKIVDSDEQLYVVIFKDCLVIWNLTLMEPQWVTKWFATDHTKTEYIKKEVTYLTLKQRSHLIKITNEI